MQLKRVVVSPTVDTSAFAAGDQLSTRQTVNEILQADGKGSILTMVNIIDKAKQSVAIDLIFFDRDVTLVSTENNALDISDADVAAAYLGHVSVLAADYTILNANSMATRACRIPLFQQGRTPGTFPLIPKHRIYMVMAVRSGTPTYAANDLTIVLVTETEDYE